MNCSAQVNNEAQYIKEDCFEGYIFAKENVKDADWMPFNDMKEKYTPSVSDIIMAERILKEQLGKINKKTLMNQGKGCPIIHRKLSRYKRQYFGYINKSGEKIIWINFIWDKKKDSLKWWNTEVIYILDGCSYFWNIKVNLSTENLFELIVNGSA